MYAVGRIAEKCRNCGVSSGRSDAMMRARSSSYSPLGESRADVSPVTAWAQHPGRGSLCESGHSVEGMTHSTDGTETTPILPHTGSGAPHFLPRPKSLLLLV